jgi:hypothetical protein
VRWAQAHFRLKDPMDPSGKRKLSPKKTRNLMRRRDAEPKVC